MKGERQSRGLSSDAKHARYTHFSGREFPMNSILKLGKSHLIMKLKFELELEPKLKEMQGSWNQKWIFMKTFGKILLKAMSLWIFFHYIMENISLKNYNNILENSWMIYCTISALLGTYLHAWINCLLDGRVKSTRYTRTHTQTHSWTHTHTCITRICQNCNESKTH